MVEKHTRTFVDQERTDTTCHRTDTGDGGNSRFWEHVTCGRENIRAPTLVSSTYYADDNRYSPRAIDTAKRLSEQSEDREESEDEHRAHTTRIWFHTFLLHKNLRQIATEQGNNGYNRIQRENEGDSLRVGSLDAKLVLEISRSPEKEEPPNAVGHELTERKRPSLAMLEGLEKTHLFLFFPLSV